LRTRAQAAAKEKDALLMRSALCRLRLHRDAVGVRNSISLRRAAFAGHVATAGGRIGFGLALSLLGPARGARLIVLAGRIVLLARTAHAAIGYIRNSLSTAPSS
jgi:hypothetical protein